MSAGVNQKLDIITEMSATVALGGQLAKLPGNLRRNTAFTKPAPLSEGMLSLYRRSKPRLSHESKPTNIISFGQTAWQAFRNNQSTQIRITDGRSISDKMAILDQYASKLYMNIRNSNSDLAPVFRTLC